MEELVRYNLDLFAEKDTELGKTQMVKMKIGTGDHKPIRLKPSHIHLGPDILHCLNAKNFLDICRNLK